jgi:uncharacterized repeat protein (TIGR03803 family)
VVELEGAQMKARINSARVLSGRVISNRQRCASLASALVLLLIAATSAQTQTFTTLYSFSGPDGNGPAVHLFQGPDVLGTTVGGGSANCGTIFKLDDTGTQTVLHSFDCGTGGAGPNSLLLEKTGSLAGTAGVVFELNSTGQENVLYSYVSSSRNLVQDAAGNFYGTAAVGAYPAFGGIFKVDASGVLTVLHSFSGGADGRYPGQLVLDANGNLYGVTYAGGAAGCGYTQIGCGVVFKIDAHGLLTVLHRFTGFDGEGPTTLLRDAGGNLYGSTYYGGRNSNSSCCGLIFKLDLNGNYNVLDLLTGAADHPVSLVRDASGNFYGTTQLGGDPNCNCGVLFKFDGSGNQTVLYTFTGGADGAGPNSLLQDATGNLVGANTGGAHGAGTVFKFFLLDFSLSASALTPSTVSPGGSSSSILDVTPSGGFNDSVALTCSVQPAPARAPQCSISPGSVTSGTPATLTVTTTAPTRAFLSTSGSGLLYALWLPLIGCVAIRGCGPKPSRRVALMLGCALITGLTFHTACGGGSPLSSGAGSPGTPAGTYTVSITGTDASGSLQHSTTTTVTVQ